MKKQAIKQKEERNNAFGEKEVFDEIVETVKDAFVAVFSREGDACLQLRFINGQRFRLMLEKVAK